MNLKLKNLNISNFFSFGNTEINLENRGFALVSGENHNLVEQTNSNGSGKSSLWEAICWVLTGETIRGTTDVVRIGAESDCVVKLTFSVDNDEYEITRSRGKKSNLLLLKNGNDISGKGIRDTEKILSEQLPELTLSLIGSVVILGQGLPQRFSDNTPSGRKEVLEKLSKSDFMIEDIKNRISNRKAELSAELRKVQDTLLVNRTTLESLNRAKEEYKKSLDALLYSDTDFDSIIQKNISLKNDLDLGVNTINNDISKLNESLSIEKELKLTITRAESNDKLSISEEYDNILNKWRDGERELKAEQINARNELNRVKNIVDVCPTCGQKLIGVEKPDPTPYQIKYDEITLKCDNIATQIRNIEKERAQRLRECEYRYSTDLQNVDKIIDEILSNLSVVNNELTAKQNELTKVNNEIAQITVRKETFNSQLAMYQSSIDKVTKEIAEIGNQILYNKEMEESVQSRIDIVNKMGVLATRDFRGILLSNVISFIDKKAKEYAEDVFGSAIMNFVLEGNAINIYFNNKLIENLSGGEQQKCNIIIQLALRDMLCTFSDFSCNILCLDEIFDGLDATGCERILNLISKRLTDVESVFIVTHHSDIAVPADSTITVYKDERGISSIK